MLCNLLKKQVLFLFVILIFVFNLSLVFALDYSTGGSVYGVLADIGNTNRTGALNLTLQMGTCSLANCTDIVWSAVYTNATYTSLASLGNATYFQCKATFFTENQNYSNYLFNFTIGYTTLISSGVPPNITILSPLNQSYTTNSIDFNISSSANLSLCLVSLNNWATNYTMNINSTLTGANLTNSSMPQGSSTANFWCNDTSNNINGTSQVTFYVDSINPSINITYPLNTTYSVKPTALNYTASDTNLQSCWYSLDSGATNTSVACGTNVTGLSANEGSNTWQVWANDTLNNVNSSSVTFYVDTVPPYFTTIPANQSITYGTWLGVQFVGNDALSFGTYYLGNWTTAFSINSSGWLSNKTNLPVGYYQINVTINDSSGNTNMTWFGVNLTAVPDTTPPYFTTIPATTVINYTQGFGVDFNATDETAFGYYYINWTTLFTINQSGWLTNSTPNVAVGNYYINVTINDTLNNQNSTIYLVNISKYITILTLNPTTPITYGTPTNFVANEGGCPSQLICSLNISDGVYSAGTISANYSTSGNENYTSSSVVSTVTINQASSSVGLTATTPITYGTITDFTGNSCPDASCTLNISNAIYPSGTISANYSFVGNQNYTASSSVFTVTINKANSQTSLVFDKTSPQEYPTAITPTCSIITGGTETLTLTNGTSGVAETLGVNSWNLNCSYAGNTNYTASSNFSQFTISQNTTYTLGLTATTPITYGTPTDVAGSGCPSELSCALNISNAIYPAGVINFNYSTAGNTNYSATSITKAITINQATPVITTLLNGGTSNITITYPQQVNISASASAGTVGLDKDNVNYLTNNNLNVTLGVGSYIFRANITGNQNYSDVGYSYYNVTINKASSLVYTYLNNSRGNITIMNGTQIWLNATRQNGEGIIQLYSNGTLINSGTSPLINLTTFNTVGIFNITTIYPSTQNYTSSFETWWLNVTNLNFTSDITAPNLTIISPLNNADFPNFISSVTIDANFSVTDTNLQSCKYEVKGPQIIANTTIPCSAGYNTFSYVMISAGSFTLRVYSNDSAGNEDISSINFTVTRYSGPQQGGGGGGGGNGDSNSRGYNQTLLCEKCWYFIQGHTDNGVLSYTQDQYDGFKTSMILDFGPTMSDSILKPFLENFAGYCSEYIPPQEAINNPPENNSTDNPPPEKKGFNYPLFIILGMVIIVAIILAIFYSVKHQRFIFKDSEKEEKG